jgi:hypothetical protein
MLWCKITSTENQNLFLEYGKIEIFFLQPNKYNAKRKKKLFEVIIYGYQGS